jgi:hypothetical protein
LATKNGWREAHVAPNCDQDLNKFDWMDFKYTKKGGLKLRPFWARAAPTTEFNV